MPLGKEALSVKANALRSTAGTHRIKERTSPCKLTSDHQMCTMAHPHIQKQITKKKKQINDIPIIKNLDIGSGGQIRQVSKEEFQIIWFKIRENYS